MRGDNQSICILTKAGKPRRVKRHVADELVENGAKFIDRTTYFALSNGVNVPKKVEDLGDKAVKGYVRAQLSRNKKAEEQKEKKSKEKPKGEKAKKNRRRRKGDTRGASRTS